MDVFDTNKKWITIGLEVSYKYGDKMRFATVTDITTDGRLYCDDNLLELLPDEVTIVEEHPVERLEADMRRYIFDKTPDRRRMCLEAYRERLGLKGWAEAQQEESEARQRLYEANQTNGD